MGFFKDVVPLIVMVAAECSHIGSTMLFKAASLKGMSYLVFLVYAYSFQALMLFPCLFVFRSFRTTILPSAKVPLIYRYCLAGLIGGLAVISGNKGLELTSPTLSASIGSLTPAFTFILAVILRLHTLNFVDRVLLCEFCL
ncbi:hypothetical protein ACFE04_010039 [Oxalis oulophora]